METLAREKSYETEHTAAPVPAGTVRWRHTRIRLTTGRATEFVDITDRLRAFVAAAGIGVGFINVQTLHTTTAIVVNEHEPPA